MKRARRFPLIAGLVLVVTMVPSCARTPSRSSLVKKLEQVNGLTPTQARCVAAGLYDGMPAGAKGDLAIRKLSDKELRAVAKADNAGKVHVETVTTLREVVSRCVSATLPAGSP